MPRSPAVAGLSMMILTLVAAACASPVAEPTEKPPIEERQGSTSQAIVGGSPSSAAQDATVLVLDGGKPSCTGTLIASNLVLTARHCVTNFNMSSDCGKVVSDAPASVFTISAGPYADQQQVARGAKVYVPASQEVFCNGNDIALILLDKDVPNAKIAKVRFTPPTLNEIGTAVGYGTNNTRTQRSDVKVFAIGPTATTYTTKNGTTFSNIDVDANEYVTTESTCFGDSGGPLLDADGQVFGVASEGLDSSCADRPTFYVGTTKHAQLIKDAAVASGHPLDPSTTTPNPTTTTNQETVTKSETNPNDPAQKAAASNADDEPADRDKSSLQSSAGCAVHSAAGLGEGKRWSAGVSGLGIELGLTVAITTLLRRRSRRRAKP